MSSLDVNRASVLHHEEIRRELARLSAGSEDLNSLPYIIADLKGRSMFVSDEAAAMFGRERGAFAGRVCGEVVGVPDDVIEALPGPLQEQLADLRAAARQAVQSVLDNAGVVKVFMAVNACGERGKHGWLAVQVTMVQEGNVVLGCQTLQGRAATIEKLVESVDFANATPAALRTEFASLMPRCWAAEAVLETPAAWTNMVTFTFQGLASQAGEGHKKLVATTMSGKTVLETVLPGTFTVQHIEDRLAAVAACRSRKLLLVVRTQRVEGHARLDELWP